MRCLALAALLLAGCLSDAPPDPAPEPEQASEVEPQWARRAVFGPNFGDFGPGDPVDHDHSDRSIHNASTPNFEVVGWDPLTTSHHGQSAGGYYCGEVSAGERKLAVVNSFTSQVAVVVMDVTDPASPRMLGELVLPNAQVYDSAITDDGRFAVLATSPLLTAHEDTQPRAAGQAAGGTAEARAPPAAATQSVRPEWHDACGNVSQGPLDVLPFVSGVMLVDIREPTAPAVADFVSQPAIGPHSVSAADIGGSSYVVASTTNLLYTASFFSVFTVEEAGGQAKLVPFATYSAHYDQQVEQGRQVPVLLNGHVDATLEEHASGDLMLWVANWDGGLHAVRLSAGQATKIAEFGARDPARGSITGAIHSAQPVGVRDNRSYLLTGQEVGGSLDNGEERRPTGQIVLLDTTDPANPDPVARWTLPVDVAWSGNLHMSTHYMTMVDDVLFVANYHNGLWAADARAEHWPDLPSLGVFMPTFEPPGGTATDTSYAPYVLDVLPLGGEVLVFDSTSGAYVVRLHRDVEVVPAAPWPDNDFIG